MALKRSLAKMSAGKLDVPTRVYTAEHFEQVLAEVRRFLASNCQAVQRRFGPNGSLFGTPQEWETFNIIKKVSKTRASEKRAIAHAAAVLLRGRDTAGRAGSKQSTVIRTRLEAIRQQIEAVFPHLTL